MVRCLPSVDVRKSVIHRPFSNSGDFSSEITGPIVTKFHLSRRLIAVCVRPQSFRYEGVFDDNFYAPNFEEVEGAYWFGPVRMSV